MYAVASRTAAGDVILKVVNVSSQPQPVQVELAGLDGRVASADATVLTSASPDDENSLDEPTKVAPATRSIPAGASFQHAFPPHSATVLRLCIGK